MEKTKKQKVDLTAFGVTAEEIEKTSDIYPTLDLGQLQPNDNIEVEFMANEPKEIEKKDTKYGKTAKVIHVRALEMDYSLFLSAKTLAIGIARIAQKHDGNLIGVKVKITKTIAQFKEGENNCYSVMEVEKTE